MKTFQGYVRADGQVGIRNNVIIMAATNYVNSLVSAIAGQVPGAIPLRHTDGAGDTKKSPFYDKLLINLARNPNHYAVVLVGLGGPDPHSQALAEGIAKLGKPFFYADLEQLGTRAALVEKAVGITDGFVKQAAVEKKEEVPMSKVILGTECGGSDALSGSRPTHLSAMCPTGSYLRAVPPYSPRRQR